MGLPFNWNVKVGTKHLKVGILKAAFDEKPALPDERANDLATLATLRKMGFKLHEIALPDYPIAAASLVAWFGEMGSVWDDLIRSGGDALLEGQESDGIGHLCRMTRMVPAVESTRANRIRTLIMRSTAKIFDEVDVYVAPYSNTDTNPPMAQRNMQLTTFTWHPAVAVQNGFTKAGSPTGITLIGKLFGEAELLAIGRAYQEATGFHLMHPKL
jgi:Asp-tRNA(Asn)/Glu-tRNA(Gln) amidotransferase A subunit family amidase